VSRESVLAEVDAERVRQDERWGEQNHPDGTGSRTRATIAELARKACQQAAAEGTVTWRHILAEEVAEAHACADTAALRAELVQVAAVAVNWIEAIDRRTTTAVRCCEMHNQHCEPPSELCCEHCTEATHGMWVQTPTGMWPASHADGSTCVLTEEGRTDG